MSKYLVVVLVCLSLTLSGCGDGGGGGGTPPDPCASPDPFPCLNEDWTPWVYTFQGDRFLYETSSNGDYAAVAWEPWFDPPDPQGMAIGGPITVQCYYFPYVLDYFEGYWDPETGYWTIYMYLEAATGFVDIFEGVLTISALRIFGAKWGDDVAYYHCKYQLPVEVLGALEATPEGFLEAVKKARAEHTR